MQWSKNRRVLIIDDNPSIHADFRKILGGRPVHPGLDAKEAVLFGPVEGGRASGADDAFDIDSASQGEEGLEMALQARREGCPYALAFVDLRMPPGMDGVETIERIWPLDAEMQFVICSAYSDYSAQDIVQRLGCSDRLLLLRKPCDGAEILLLAMALCEKWNLAHAMKEATST
ncbi:MAG: response regulator transcription factor [Pirellulales bacterium]